MLAHTQFIENPSSDASCSRQPTSNTVLHVFIPYTSDFQPLAEWHITWSLVSGQADWLRAEDSSK